MCISIYILISFHTQNVRLTRAPAIFGGSAGAPRVGRVEWRVEGGWGVVAGRRRVAAGRRRVAGPFSTHPEVSGGWAPTLSAGDGGFRHGPSGSNQIVPPCASNCTRQIRRRL